MRAALLSKMRMKPGIKSMVAVFVAAVVGCRSGSKSTPLATDVPPGASAPATGARAPAGVAPLAQTDAVFSAPIAVARVGSMIVVAGLDASDAVVRVVGLRDGRPRWKTDVLGGVAWTPNADLSLQAAGDGSAVLWRSGLGTAGPSKLVLLGPEGQLRGAPVDVPAAFCVTGAGLAWIEPVPRTGSRILARAWSEREPRSLVVLPPEETPALACGDRSVFVLADGDDALTVTGFVPGDAAARAPAVAIRDTDFADDERDHQAFTVGDTLEIVRVGEQGAIAMRDMPVGDGMTPWRKLKHALGADDDIVAIDGTPTTTLVVFTRDADDACPSVGSLAQRVKALEVDRKSGAESVLELAPADCTRSVGPFWVAAASDEKTDSVVGWTERRRQGVAKAPPISGLAYRRIDDAGGVRSGRVDVDTDALAAGGCDHGQCIVGALLRPPGDAGAMQPMAIRVFAYP